MTPNRRRLPHIYPEGSPLFLTWHLHGSVPPSSLPPPGSLTSDVAFVWLDRQLDTLRTGPMYLRQPEIARIVVESIHKGADLRHYELGAFAEGDHLSGVRADQVRRIKDVLAHLDLARHPGDLDLPGYRLHPLPGKLKGHWSVTISGNWRVVFRFADGDAFDVDLVDYH